MYMEVICILRICIYKCIHIVILEGYENIDPIWYPLPIYITFEGSDEGIFFCSTHTQPDIFFTTRIPNPIYLSLSWISESWVSWEDYIQHVDPNGVMDIVGPFYIY
jgi:hypothetical protein